MKIYSYTCPKCGRLCEAYEDEADSYVCECGTGWHDSINVLKKLYSSASYELASNAVIAAEYCDEKRELAALSRVAVTIANRMQQIIDACNHPQSQPTEAELHAEVEHAEGGRL